MVFRLGQALNAAVVLVLGRLFGRLRYFRVDRRYFRKAGGLSIGPRVRRKRRS